MIQTFRGFHGTRTDLVESIAEEGLRPSRDHDEWLGPGSYYFIDGLEDASAGARDWARVEAWDKRSRRYPETDFAVIEYAITVDTDRIFDLRAAEHAKEFHRVRDAWELPDEPQALTAVKGVGSKIASGANTATRPFRNVDLDGDGIADEAQAVTAVKGAGSKIATGTTAVAGKVAAPFNRRRAKEAALSRDEGEPVSDGDVSIVTAWLSGGAHHGQAMDLSVPLSEGFRPRDSESPPGFLGAVRLASWSSCCECGSHICGTRSHTGSSPRRGGFVSASGQYAIQRVDEEVPSGVAGHVPVREAARRTRRGWAFGRDGARLAVADRAEPNAQDSRTP